MKTPFWNLARLIPILCFAYELLPQKVSGQSLDYIYTANNGAITITGYTGSGGAVSIPSTIDGLPVTSIGEDAFTFSSLTSVIIPNSVTSIGYGAFSASAGLTSVLIPESVTSIGERAFSACGSLNALIVDADNPVYSSVDGVLFNKAQTTLIQCPQSKAGSYIIPNSVTSIGYEAFSTCNGLNSVIIPNSLTSIGGWAFYACTRLTSVIIPNSVISLGESALFSCTSLTNVVLGSSVTSIGTRTFYSCTSLTNLTIPENVTNIADYAVCDCSSLTGVYFEGNSPSGGENVFSGSTKVVAYYLPGTAGWETSYGGRPTAFWVLPYPLILVNNASFGIQTNRFGFTISWATNVPVVVEVSMDLGKSSWSPSSTNTLADGYSYFSDPEWRNYPARFYRVRSH
jgi:hypothetical protein